MDLLIVEDDPSSRAALSEVLEDEGHCVRSAANAADAMTLVAERSPALLLLDHNLPDMSGLELVAKLRSEGVETPFVLITGTSEMHIDPDGNVDITNHEQAALAIGALAHLTKPVPIDALLAVLDALGE